MGEGVEGRGEAWGRYDPMRLAVYRLARRHTRLVAALLARSDTRGHADLAKASVTEAWGHTDSLVEVGIARPGSIAEIRDLQNQMVALLITMIRTQESRSTR